MIAFILLAVSALLIAVFFVGIQACFRHNVDLDGVRVWLLTNAVLTPAVVMTGMVIGYHAMQAFQ